MSAHPTPAAPRPGRPGLTPEATEALQLIAEGVTAVAGFGVAAIGLVRDQHLETVAVAGDPGARADLLGNRTAMHLIEAELAVADDWGLLKFVPHERIQTDLTTWGWVPDVEPGEGPDAWHPLDMLTAPLLDADGVMRGMLSIDLPDDGVRPGPARRRLLERYAEQASRNVLVALEREELALQVRLAETARTVVRQATRQRSISAILEQGGEALVEGFRAVGMWIQTFDEDGRGTGRIYSENGTDVVLPANLLGVAEQSARACWREQDTRVVARGHVDDGLTDDQRTRVVDFLDTIEVGSILFVPLGVGPECLGSLVLTRRHGGPAWTDTEASAALDIGRDLGTAIINVRAFEREHQLVKELQALDQYKGQLIATVAHELKNPLTSIVGYLEMLDGDDDASGVASTLDPATRQALSAMDRGAQRMVRVIDDLLLLSKVGDPANPVIARPVDLRQVAADAIDLCEVAARKRALRLEVHAPAHPVMAWGDADELDRVISNLVSNAVKYTHEGRTVTLTLEQHGEHAVIACTDQGFGISEADQERLFTEFFRSTNPEAVAQPGTGLGLAIVGRILQRHGGRIEVESELGHGSTFRVTLPAPPPLSAVQAG